VHCGLVLPPEGTLALVGHDTVSPAGAETLMLTVPENPWRLVRVMLPVVEPTEKEMLGADKVKSVIVTGTLAEFEREPLVAVKVTV